MGTKELISKVLSGTDPREIVVEYIFYDYFGT